MEVIWSANAKKQVALVLAYCKKEFGVEVSKRFAQSLSRDNQRLAENPYMGALEPLLSHRMEQFRYLVESHYKIIYFVKGEILYVVALWDCRQHPNKLKRLLPK